MHRTVKCWRSMWVVFGFALMISLTATGAAISFDTPWSWTESPCTTTGDVMDCSAAVAVSDNGIQVDISTRVNQDSPLWGVTSSAFKELRFERTLTLEEAAEVRILAVLTGNLSVAVEGGAARITARLALIDPNTGAPVGDLRLDSESYGNQLSPALEGSGSMPIAEAVEQASQVPAGTYILRGTLTAQAEVPRGWWNKEAATEAGLAVRLSSPTLQTDQNAPSTETVQPEPADTSTTVEPVTSDISTDDGIDWLVVPVGEADSALAHLEPGTQGGTLDYASISSPGTWNPVVSKSNADSEYTNLMFPGLVAVDPTNAARVPELATGWEISEDQLTLTFHLRRGLVWSDGVPFTADDVLFTFNDLIYNEDVDADGRDVLRLPDGTYPQLTKIDDHTVQISLSMPFRPILNSLGMPILPKHVLASHVHKLNPDVEPGTFNSVWSVDTDPTSIPVLGPFRLVEYVMDQLGVLERNPNYYHVDSNGTKLPYIDRIHVHIVENQDVSMLKFTNGELDVYGTRAEDVAILLEETESKDMTVIVSPDLPVYGTSWVGINQDIGLAEGTHEQLRTLFRDIRFRKAIAHAVDKDTIIANVYRGLAVPQWSPVSLLSPYYAGRDTYGGPITENDAVIYEYDLSTTATLLDEVGIIDRDEDGWRDFEDGTRVQIEFNTNPNTTREAISLIIAEDLQSVGLDVAFNVLDFNTLVQRLNGSTAQMILLGLGGSSEPNSGANVYSSSGGLHFWRYSAGAEPNEVEMRVDELLAAGVATYDTDEAFAIYKEYQLLLTESDLGLIYTTNRAFTYAYYNRVRNAQIANPIATPSGGSPRATELVFLKTE